MRLIDADVLKEKYELCRNEYNSVMNMDGGIPDEPIHDKK